MKIVSQVKDYYDCIQRMDEDRTVVYLRTPRTEETSNEWLFPVAPHQSGHYGRLSLHQSIIGFCGKIYPCLRICYGPAYVSDPKAAIVFSWLMSTSSWKSISTTRNLLSRTGRQNLVVSSGT